MSGLADGTFTECPFQNFADHTAVASTSSEATLLAGTNRQPTFSVPYFRKAGQAFVIEGAGILGTTGTPTFTLSVVLGTTQGSSNIGTTILGKSAAITTSSGVSNKWFQFRVLCITTTVGQGTGATTLNCSGFVWSPGGFASPFVYALTPSTGESATWTCTLDGNLAQYANATLTWSASSSSNTATLKQLIFHNLN